MPATLHTVVLSTMLVITIFGFSFVSFSFLVSFFLKLTSHGIVLYLWSADLSESPKKAERSIFRLPHPSPHPHVAFPKLKLWFFVTFDVVLSQIFPENFIDIPQVGPKIWRLSFNVSYFQLFSSTFWIFWHLFVTKKLITSTYNRWCQHFFTFNILHIDCLTTVKSCIAIRLVLLENMKGGQIDPSHLEKTTLKKPSLIRVRFK